MRVWHAHTEQRTEHGFRISRLDFQLILPQLAWPWANYLNALSLILNICKLEIITPERTTMKIKWSTVLKYEAQRPFKVVVVTISWEWSNHPRFLFPTLPHLLGDSASLLVLSLAPVLEGFAHSWLINPGSLVAGKSWWFLFLPVSGFILRDNSWK